jgi:hypothetical protein
MIKFFSELLLSIAVILACVCSFTDTTSLSGGGSSTGNANTIAGILMKPDGKTPAGCKVSLYRSDGIPVLFEGIDTSRISSDLTNNEGKFVLKDIPDGSYTIYCIDTTGIYSKLLFNATVKGRDSLFIGIVALRFATSIAGLVSNANGVQTIAFIYGSPIITSVDDTSGAFILRGIPSGDSAKVTFKALDQINGKSCQAEYRFSQLPDTALFVNISLQCH